MKNKFLALGAAALLFASCSDDDSSGSIDQSLLTKKWYYVSYTVDGETYPYEDHETCGKDYLEFKTGGVFNSVDVVDCTEEIVTGTWSANGNKVSIVAGGETTSAKVAELTTQTLKVQASYDFDGDGSKETVTEICTSTP